MRAPFVTVEGIDGVGKSSHMETLTRAMASLGCAVVQTKEPGGTELGERLRMEFKTTPMAVQTAVMLAFAIRAEHLDKVIRPALARGDAVLSDRFVDSTYAYQGAADGYPIDAIEQLEAQVCGDLRPDLTLWFDAEVKVAASRRDRRAADAQDTALDKDKFDAKTPEWFSRAREGYFERLDDDPSRMVRIDAGQSFEIVADQVRKVVDEFVKDWRVKMGIPGEHPTATQTARRAPR